MSLARIALRIASVEALKGRTLVGENVLDSRIGALETNAEGELRGTDQKRPFIAVYTDGSKVNGPDIELRGMVGNGIVELLFEMGVTAAMTDTNEAGASTIIGVGIPATDHNFEFTLDLLARQIADALTDPDNEWAEVFRGLSFRFVSIERARTGNIVEGVRLAGQQVKIGLELVDDPLHGQAIEPGTPFAVMLEKMDASGNAALARQAELIRAQIAGSDADWEMAQRHQGMTAAELLALGLGPVAGDKDRTTPMMNAGVIDLDGIIPAIEVSNG